MNHVIDNYSASSANDLVTRYWYKPQGPRHAAVRGAGWAGFTTISHYDPLLRPISLYNDLPAPGNDMENRDSHQFSSQSG